jgi:phosphate-selective porin OprO/OprP
MLLLFFLSESQSKVSFDLGGRMEVDYSYYDDDFTPFIQEDYDVRRFRFGLFTQFNKKFSAYFQSDFADTRRTKKGATQAAWFRYRANKNNEFYLGKMEMPFSLESVSNSKYHFFMERSIASAISERYGTGFNYIHYGNTWNMRLGVFGDDHFDLGSSSTYGKAVTGRIGKKVKAFNSAFYLGSSIEYREPETIQKFRTLPESHTFNGRLLDTGELFFVQSIEKIGLEALWKKKSWTLQAEYIQNKFNREFGNNLNYDSGYVIINKIFNGRRRFSYRKGEWASTKVNNWRTWELSARYSFLDLRDSDLNAGIEENYAVGINYYMSNKNRMMFNYIQAHASPNSFGINETLNIYQVRFQFEF